MNYEINHSDKSIKWQGRYYVIPRKEFEIFSYLNDNKGRIVSRQELLDNIWEAVIVDNKTIDVHINRLRNKFPEAPIKTRRCYGYVWESNHLQ